MSWFKEIKTLISMVFHRTSGHDGTQMIQMDHFPFEGYAYMTWCGDIIYRKKRYEDIKERTKRHEGIHVIQSLGFSHWYKFYWKYLIEYFKGFSLMNPMSAAYYMLPFELEAYANEDKLDYKTTQDSYKKYSFKNRRKLFKELGGKIDFRKWCKEVDWENLDWPRNQN